MQRNRCLSFLLLRLPAPLPLMWERCVQRDCYISFLLLRLPVQLPPL